MIKTSLNKFLITEPKNYVFEVNNKKFDLTVTEFSSSESAFDQYNCSFQYYNETSTRIRIHCYDSYDKTNRYMDINIDLGEDNYNASLKAYGLTKATYALSVPYGTETSFNVEPKDSMRTEFACKLTVSKL